MQTRGISTCIFSAWLVNGFWYYIVPCKEKVLGQHCRSGNCNNRVIEGWKDRHPESWTPVLVCRINQSSIGRWCHACPPERFFQVSNRPYRNRAIRCGCRVSVLSEAWVAAAGSLMSGGTWSPHRPC